MPGPISVSVHLIKCNEDDLNFDFGWEPLCREIHEHFADATHEEMISWEQAVEGTLAAIDSVVESRSGSSRCASYKSR